MLAALERQVETPWVAAELAERLASGGRGAEAGEQLERALPFFRRARADACVTEAERLLGAAA